MALQYLLRIPVMEIIACLRKKGLPCIGHCNKNEKVAHKQRRWTIQMLLHCQLMLHDGSPPQLLLFFSSSMLCWRLCLAAFRGFWRMRNCFVPCLLSMTIKAYLQSAASSMKLESSTFRLCKQ